MILKVLLFLSKIRNPLINDLQCSLSCNEWEAILCSFSRTSIPLLWIMLTLGRAAAVRSPGVIFKRLLDTKPNSACLRACFFLASFSVVFVSHSTHKGDGDIAKELDITSRSFQFSQKFLSLYTFWALPHPAQLFDLFSVSNVLDLFHFPKLEHSRLSRFKSFSKHIVYFIF